MRGLTEEERLFLLECMPGPDLSEWQEATFDETLIGDRLVERGLLRLLETVGPDECLWEVWETTTLGCQVLAYVQAASLVTV